MASKNGPRELLWVLAYIIGIQVSVVRLLARKVEWHFLRLYLNKHREQTEQFLQYLFEEFREPRYFDGYSTVLIYGPGRSEQENYKVCWETPLGYALWHNDQPAIAMGVEVKSGMLCVRQLQGVRGTQLPKELRNWPELFVRAAMKFASDSGLKGVRVYRAHMSNFYWMPDFGYDVLTQEQYRERLRAHRNRMRARYDGTARKMGFRMKKYWGEWFVDD